MTDARVPNPDPGIRFDPPPLPVEAYFPLDRKAQLPPDDTFEIGLVLGGTVSAAAYTAGVVDFLIQALDAWTVAKNAGSPDAPDHKVRIRIMAGTSGGAITCTLLTRVLAYAFPHATEQTSPAIRRTNPFYDCWVNRIDIRDLLATDDLNVPNPQISSLLCAGQIDRMCQKIADYPGTDYLDRPLGQDGTPPVRDYFDQLLPVILTMTNLRGTPYYSNFRGVSGRSEYYTDHADHACFRVDITGANPPIPNPPGANPPDPDKLLPFEIGISEKAGGEVQPWTTMIKAARCSSAFPVGLPPQSFSRKLEDYRYRHTVIDGAAVWMRPAWNYMTPIGRKATDPYQFLAVDGGCFNNEPTEYARQFLAGVLGHNDQTARGAHRAVLLVDPFADVPDYGLEIDNGLVKTGGATLSAFTGGARYETADLDLFTSEDVFSRFLINPVRQDPKRGVLTGGDAIATDNLAAFGGFLSATFRHHDFMLGRRNCQKFLRSSFALDKDNSLFNKWTDPQRDLYGKDDPQFLPVIPLVGDLMTEILPPVWPKDTFLPDSIGDALRARLNKLAAIGVQQTGLFPNWLPSFLSSFAADKAVSLASKSLADRAIKTIAEALQSSDLLDKR